MKNQDKYTKAGNLSLQLQKYEVSQKEKQTVLNAEPLSIPDEEIHAHPPPSAQGSPKTHKLKSHSRERHHEKSSSIRFAERKPSVDLEDQNELLQKCMNLTTKVQLLKREKYEQAIQQFQEEQRKKLQFLFEKEKKATGQKYNQRRNQIKQMHERQSVRIAKGLEDIKKFKEAYNSILEDLGEKKSKLQREYEQALQEIRQVKQRLVQEWKRSSNEQIIKKCNILFK